MLAIIIITLATTTPAYTHEVLFPDDERLDDKPKIVLTKSVTLNITTSFCDPANYPDSVITNLVKRNGSFDNFFEKDEGSITLLTLKTEPRDAQENICDTHSKYIAVHVLSTIF